MPKFVTMSFRIESKAAEKVRAAAHKGHRTFSDYIRWLLERAGRMEGR
jgi:hypothetical protein